MQLAIEVVFGERSMPSVENPTSKRMRQDRLFARLATDALYYPAVEWGKGQAKLDISRQAFRDYLEARLNGDADFAHGAGNCELSNAADLRVHVTELDFDLLYEIFQDLLGHLRNPNILLWQMTGIDHFGRALILPLVTGQDNEDVWYWLWDPFGRAITLPKTEEGPAHPSPAPEAGTNLGEGR